MRRDGFARTLLIGVGLALVLLAWLVSSDEIATPTASFATSTTLPAHAVTEPAATIAPTPAVLRASDVLVAAPAAAAVLEICLSCSGPVPERVWFEVATSEGARVAHAMRVGERKLRCEFEVPSNQWLSVGARVENAGREVAVVPVRTVLVPGERRRVDLVASGNATCFQLRGPSAALLALLTVELVRRDELGSRSRSVLSVAPAGDGALWCDLGGGTVCATVPGCDGESVPLADGGELDLRHREGPIELRPLEPLLGFALVGGDKPFAAAVSLREPVTAPTPRTAPVTTRARAEPQHLLFGCSENHTVFAAPLANARREGDLWTVEILPQHWLGRLEVTVPGAAGSCGLRAADLATATAQPLAMRGAMHSCWLVPGDYRLQWWRHDSPGPVAMEFARVVGGETARFEVTAPRLQRWQLIGQWPPACEVALFASLRGARTPVGSRTGELSIELWDAPRVGEQVELALPALGVATRAHVTAVDPVAAIARLDSPLTAARWVRVTAVPSGSGAVALCLQRDAALAGFGTPELGAMATVPVWSGSPRSGCVFAGSGNERDLVAWFTLDARSEAVTVHAAGRRVPLTIAMPVATATLVLEHAAMGEQRVRRLVGRGQHAVFVADGTRAVHVDLVPGGRRTFDPALPAFLVQ